MMTNTSQEIECLKAYLQLDAPARAACFSNFTLSLKKLAESDGNEAAWTWARQAVSPLLDYSSLMKLRRFLPARNAVDRVSDLPRLAIVGGPTTIQLRQIIDVFLAGEGLAAE